MTKNETLKILARLAKKRMNGNTDSQNQKFTQIDFENKILKDKIRNILLTDKDTTSPISKLIDYNKYNVLTVQQKQKYLFELVEIYNSVKNQYEKESFDKSLVC